MIRVYHEFHRQVPGQSDADVFAMGLNQVVRAEAWGLDAVWLAEIHQQAERSVMSAPLTVLAAVASRTTRLKLGTGAQVPPLTHPLRLAEETATVDQISRGRLLMGVGRSGNPASYQAYGVPYAESRDRFYETLEVLRLAWTQTRFSFDGKFHKFNDVRAVPRLFQSPHPPIRIAGASEDTFPTLGRLGFPLFVAVRSGSLAALAPDLVVYRDAYRAAGHPGRGEIHLRLTMHVADTDAAAQSKAHDSIMAGYQKLISQLEGSPNARRRAELEATKRLTYDDIPREKVVIGSPATVAARLSQLRDQLGIDGILAELNFGAILPPETMMRSLQLLCQDVRARL